MKGVGLRAAALWICIVYVNSEVVREHHPDLRWNSSSWKKRRDGHQGSGLSDAALLRLASPTASAQFEAALHRLLVPRLPATPSHARVREDIVSELRALQWSVDTPSHLAQTPGRTETRFTNIVATLDPHAPRRLVLACHYDSLRNPPGFIGATDSALPCAQLMSVAYELRTALEEHRRGGHEITLQLIFFDGEEAFVRWSDSDSLYGARRLAATLHGEPFGATGATGVTHLTRMDMFVLLDLLGAANPRFYSYFRNTEPWYIRLMSFERRYKQLGHFTEVPPMFRNATRYGSGIQDDHIPFLRRGVPILHIIPSPFPSVWHKASDNGDALDRPTYEAQNALWRALVADYLHLTVRGDDGAPL